MLVDIVQDGEEDDQQFFVKVYLALFVDRVHIDGTVVLHHSVCPCNSPSPVYLIETSVHVLDDEQKELLVVIVKLYQRQQNVKERIVTLLAPLVYLGHLLVIDYRSVISLVVVEYYYGTVNPHREVIDEVLLFICQLRILSDADNILRAILAEYQFLAVLHFEQHLRKNKDTVVNVRVTIEVISHIVHRDVAIDVLQSINTMDGFPYIVSFVSVFLY